MCFVCRVCCLVALIGVSATLSSCSDFGVASVPSPIAAPQDTSLHVESTPSPAVIESTAPQPELVTPEVSSEPSDGATAEAFLGTWQLYDHGTRTIVVNPDGTATMHVELDFFGSLIYGSEMTLDLEWSVAEGVLSYSILRGEPVESVDRVINDYGRERSYGVIEISDEALQLEDLAYPGTFHDWTKIGDQG